MANVAQGCPSGSHLRIRLHPTCSLMTVLVVTVLVIVVRGLQPCSPITFSSRLSTAAAGVSSLEGGHHVGLIIQPGLTGLVVGLVTAAN